MTITINTETHPAVLVADILRERLSHEVQYLDPGEVPAITTGSLIRCKQRLTPVKKSAVNGWTRVQVLLQSVRPSTDKALPSLLDSIPKLQRGSDPLVTEDGSILAIELHQRDSGRLAGGSLVDSVTATVTVVDRAPVLQGSPLDYRFSHLASAIKNSAAGAHNVTQVQHSSQVRDEFLTVTFSAVLVSETGGHDPHAFHSRAQKGMNSFTGRLVDGVGRVDRVQVGDVRTVPITIDGMPSNRSAIQVPVTFTMLARIPA